MVRPLMRGGVPVLKRASSKPRSPQGPTDAGGGRFAHAAAGQDGLAHVEQALHKRAGAEHDGPRPVDHLAGHADAGDMQ